MNNNRRPRGSRAARARSTRPSPASTTHTVTVRDTQTPILRLQLHPRRRVRWSSDTHDNEHDGKRSSKSCCVFHKKRAWDESSSESEAEGDHGNSDGDDGNKSDGSSSSSGGPATTRRRVPSNAIVEDSGPMEDHGEGGGEPGQGGDSRNQVE